MSYNFDGKIALITGGSSGIGRATALAFADTNATVIIASRKKKRGEEVQAILKEKNKDSIWIQADTSERASIENLFNSIKSNFTKLDFAFNYI